MRATIRRPTAALLPVACAALLLVQLAAGPAGAGSFSVLTYNVAGLPLGFSSSNPEVNTPLISPLLNGFDLVAVQEDFGFHDELIAQVDHPYLSAKDDTSVPGLNLPIGDGLNRMSRSPFTDFTRVTWNECFGFLTNGSDCLAPKGFSVARHELAPGAFLDVYNLHADAKDDDLDKAARRSQIRQLYAFMESFSAGRAVIVLGDTNSRYTRLGDILPELLQEAGLQDVWVELARGGDRPAVGPKVATCAENGLAGGDCELVDKIFFRSGGGLLLHPSAYAVPAALFVDPAGAPLSDHDPVSALFEFSVVPEPGTASLLALGLASLRTARRRCRAAS